MTAERIETDPKGLSLDERVDAIIAPWERREGARGTLSNAEMHARSVVNTARAAVRELLELHDRALTEAVETAVKEVTEELGGLNEALISTNTDLAADVDRHTALLERLGMSHTVATQVAVELGWSITRVVVVPGGGTVGAGSVSYDVGDDVVVVYNAGIEPSVEVANTSRTSVVIYLVGANGLESTQLDAIGTLFRPPTSTQPPTDPEEATRRMPPSCTE